MIGLWKDKDPMIAELHEARTALALRSEEDDEVHKLNLRLHEAIEAVEKRLDEAYKVPPKFGDDSHPYWRLYLREYDAHLATKKSMTFSNGGIQAKLKLAEDKFTEAITLLAFERLRVAELRRVLGDKLNEVCAE